MCVCMYVCMYIYKYTIIYVYHSIYILCIMSTDAVDHIHIFPTISKAPAPSQNARRLKACNVHRKPRFQRHLFSEVQGKAVAVVEQERLVARHHLSTLLLQISLAQWCWSSNLGPLKSHPSAWCLGMNTGDMKDTGTPQKTVRWSYDTICYKLYVTSYSSCWFITLQKLPVRLWARQIPRKINQIDYV